MDGDKIIAGGIGGLVGFLWTWIGLWVTYGLWAALFGWIPGLIIGALAGLIVAFTWKWLLGLLALLALWVGFTIWNENRAEARRTAEPWEDVPIVSTIPEGGVEGPPPGYTVKEDRIGSAPPAKR